MERQSDDGSDLPSFQDAKFVRQARDQGWMFFRVEDRQRMIAKGEDGGVGGVVGRFPPEDHPAVAQVKAVKETEGEVADRFSRGRGGEGVDDGHVRRMREISGREIRWRAR